MPFLRKGVLFFITYIFKNSLKSLFTLKMCNKVKISHFTPISTFLQDSCFMKENARHSVGHRRKQLIDFVTTRQNKSSNFLLHGKVCQIIWMCRMKMGAPILQKNFGWLSRQWDVSVNSRVLKLAYNTLPVVLGNITSSGVSNGVEK